MDEKNEIAKKLKESRNVMLVLKSRGYETKMMEFHKTISKEYKKIGMVAVSKPSIVLIKDLEKHGIDASKYYFIDCTMGGTEEASAIKQTVHISGSVTLTELAIAISKMIESKKIDLLILDGISSLLIYNDELMLTKFLHRIMSLVQLADTKGVYTVLEKDMAGLIKDAVIFTDAVIKITDKGTIVHPKKGMHTKKA